MTSALKKWAMAIIVAHFLVLLAHGTAHVELEIGQSTAESVFIFIVIWAAPIISFFLLLKGRLRAGALILFFSMLGSLLFGAYKHFIEVSPDNLSYAPDGAWLLPFQITAVLLALVEIAGIVSGLLILRSHE